MALFDLELSEGLNAVSIPLIFDEESGKWSNILEGVAFNSVRTLTDGVWQDFLRGRPSDLNDFDSTDFKKGYLIDVVRVGNIPNVTTLTPSLAELAQNDYADSVYSDDETPLFSVPLRHTGALWIRTPTTAATNSDASYLSFTIDRSINLYIGYDATATLIPSWLDDWDETGEQITAGENTYSIYRLPTSAGAIAIPGNQNGGGNASNMYVVFMEEDSYPLEVNTPIDSQITLLDEGKTFYLDRLYIVTDLPEEVENMDWVRLNNDDYTDTTTNYFQMDIEDEGYIYVAYPEAGCPVPEWLEDFDLLDERIETSALTFKLYRKWSAAGTVTLGGASAVTIDGSNAAPGANYIVGAKKIGLASVTITLEGDEPSGIIDIPIVGTDKDGVSLIGFPKSSVGETGIAENIDARGIQYENLMRLRKGIWDSHVPDRDETLNWAPPDLERGLGYFIRSTIADDQVLEIDYDS